MIGFSLHPNVYATGPYPGLIRMLETAWVRNTTPGDGEFYIISGFANYNGGVRFYDVFEKHISAGGGVSAIFSGSTSQRLTSNQVVKQLLEIGADVTVVNRKRLLHAKCYGAYTSQGQNLVVSSGNFTAPGMSQNAEASFFADNELISKIGFSWKDLYCSLSDQKWNFYKPSLENLEDPAWKLLYDEYEREVKLDETEETTLIIVLGHSDTARIQAQLGSPTSKGTQYFWLSRDSYDFFPPLTIRNKRGYKATFSCLINLRYVDLGIVEENTRVTFEAENNLDFRLGTGRLRGTKVANEGDIAVLSRITEFDYELRIIKKENSLYNTLIPYAISFIGHRGKKYGYLNNQEFEKLTEIQLGT
ncbi:hypothetical protein QA601_13785 [Chitinispirillales bacterium ANBcel5]|uniref:restriction endonuclease n=1 Tax=Cellulosispirillum alkaliphilum TaxID=3039283 RepID=UPI002A5645F1|nr:hypothetical protein [Chitinispirillales bacterium ANBcel5]